MSRDSVGTPNKEIAEAFSHHDFERTYPHMLDDIEWTMIGGRHLRGKTSVVSTCEESRAYLRGVRTTFSTFKVVAAGDSVVIDSRAQYIDGDETTLVASCDIYDFVDGSLAAITSYTQELDDTASDDPGQAPRLPDAGVADKRDMSAVGDDGQVFGG